MDTYSLKGLADFGPSNTAQRLPPHSTAVPQIVLRGLSFAILLAFFGNTA